ncbi:MAG: hypothetical protein M3Q07_27985 [Pseudobdellovibrionaceae bacterium]|nr:hypothetical protein [Pseudobdellovibrionaceae bacterium]
MAKTCPEYKRHEPEQTILYKILDEYAPIFFDMIGRDRDRKQLPGFLTRKFDKFLNW